MGCSAGLWGRCHVASRPRIYVYDLPGELTWQGIHEYARDTNYLFVNRLLRSQYRTAVPEEADYFFIPAIDNAYGIPRSASISHIQATWPHLWGRAGGRDHIMIGCHDAGAAAYFEGMDRRNNEAAMRLIFLSHSGHHIGKSKGHTQGGHIPGQDIVIPPTQYLRELLTHNGSYFARPPGAPPLDLDAQLAQRDGTLLYFAGTVTNESLSWNVRHHAALAAEGFADMKIHRKGVGANYTHGMATSLFCLGAPGQGGWGRRDTLGALHGCIRACPHARLRRRGNSHSLHSRVRAGQHEPCVGRAAALAPDVCAVSAGGAAQAERPAAGREG